MRRSKRSSTTIPYSTDGSWSAQRKAAATAHFLLNSGRYPLDWARRREHLQRVRRDVQDRDRRRTEPPESSRPPGLATDKTTSAFFGDLVSTRTLAALHDFVTNPRIWTDVGNRKFRFAVTAIRGRSTPVERIRMSFFSKYPTEVTPERVFSVTPDEIQLLNPNTGNCPVFITRADADLTIGVYRRHPCVHPGRRSRGQSVGTLHSCGCLTWRTTADFSRSVRSRPDARRRVAATHS